MIKLRKSAGGQSSAFLDIGGLPAHIISQGGGNGEKRSTFRVGRGHLGED